MAGVLFTRTGGGNRHAAGRSWGRPVCRVVTRRLRQLGVCAVSVAAITLPVGAVGAVAAQAAMPAREH